MPVVWVPSVMRSLREVAPVPPDVTARADGSVRTPAFENVAVAVPPKYAIPVFEKSVDDAPPVRIKSEVVALLPAAGCVHASYAEMPLTPFTIQFPSIPLKQPFESAMPFEKVDVAVDDVMFRAVAERPAPKVEVAEPKIVVVAVSPTYNALYTDASDDDAFAND